MGVTLSEAKGACLGSWLLRSAQDDCSCSPLSSFPSSPLTGTRMPPESRPMSYSVGTITTFVMPHMQNIRGDLFGGELMALVDQAAAVAAIRHAGGPAVTASIDRVDFRERIPVGSLVSCEATVDFVGKTSMDITVEVYAETVSTGERRHTHTAHVVFVAIDETGKPQRVPRLIQETGEEQQR